MRTIGHFFDGVPSRVLLAKVFAHSTGQVTAQETLSTCAETERTIVAAAEALRGCRAFRFYTWTKTITSRWPSGIRESGEFSIPVME